MSADKARIRLLKKYGLTPEEYEIIYQFQKGKCAICDKPASHFARRFSVDHDHSAHLVRGLLCFACNKLIPARKNLVQLLERMIRYIQFPPAVLALGGTRTCLPVKRRKKK